MELTMNLNPYAKAIMSGTAATATSLAAVLLTMNPITPAKVAAAVLGAVAAGLLTALATWAVPNAQEPEPPAVDLASYVRSGYTPGAASTAVLGPGELPPDFAD
jgi:hypothetical protein